MLSHTRAILAASAHAVITGRKVAGIYDHADRRHLRIAAECRGGRVQGLDGDRSVRFGGTLPELYDQGSKAFVTLETDGATARGYDRASAGFYTATVAARQVQLFDHALDSWFTYDVQAVDGGDAR